VPDAHFTVDIATETAEAFVLPPAGIPLTDLRTIRLADGRGVHRRHLQARDDDAVLPLVTSAHLCCGLHAGDPVAIGRVARALAARGVALGAHPSYPDLFGFGQVRMALAPEDLEAAVLYQLGALAGVLRGCGATLAHLKCHGALAFDMAYDEAVCDVMTAAVRRFDPALVMVFMAASPGLERARGQGMRVAAEGYIDRGYDRSGRLVPRDHPQALVSDPAAAARRALELVCEGRVTCVDGERIPLQVDTLCLHADTAGAGPIARAVVDALVARGVVLQPLEQVLRHRRSLTA
jgi:UPF0271 protein